MPRHFPLRRLFGKEKTILSNFEFFLFWAKLKTPNIKLIFHYLPQLLFTGRIPVHRQILGRFPLRDLKGAYLINKQ